jgi:hypothetical protein
LTLWGPDSEGSFSEPCQFSIDLKDIFDKEPSKVTPKVPLFDGHLLKKYYKSIENWPKPENTPSDLDSRRAKKQCF